MITRRLALFRIGASSAVSAVATASILTAKQQPQQESREFFKAPAEYVAAMHAIGWKALAMYQRLPGGGVHCMGVEETGGDAERIASTWSRFHAIQMRMPSQRSSDFPPGEWWGAVWQHLYDNGHRLDVTPAKLDGGEV
ncbi:MULTISPECIES: hypothetical protein [unclassified Afipia]|uniref:hypothetical protein n=1 Tax=unclassified Afipia TaxID=2642050 RepID=UPI000467A60A|nr:MULTISPECIES: hypothetical protein [unclassified Afipia]